MRALGKGEAQVTLTDPYSGKSIADYIRAVAGMPLAEALPTFQPPHGANKIDRIKGTVSLDMYVPPSGVAQDGLHADLTTVSQPGSRLWITFLELSIRNDTL